MTDSRVIFLMYHELEMPGRAITQAEPGYTRYVVSAADFRAQMQCLKDRGWKGLSVSHAVSSFQDNTVAITFDDGSETDLLSAAPILREFDFGATFYITTGWTDQPGYLSSSQLRELVSLGFEIGSHSMSHPYLSDLDEASLSREIVESKRQLEQIIGRPVEHFSCPGGRFDLRVLQVAQEAGYRTVSTSQSHANRPSTNRFALGRVVVMRATSMSKFFDMCRGRGLWQGQLGTRLRATVRNLLGNSAYDRIRRAALRKRP